jgi:hypothetical protein
MRALLAVATLLLLTPTTARADPLPLGRADLTEVRTSEPIAPGVTHTRIVRGEPSASERFVVDVAFAPTRDAARAVRDALRADGYDARVQRVAQRAPDDPARGPLGFLVRSGAFAAEPDAIALRERLVAAGYASPRVVYTGEDGGRTSGPWVLDVLAVEPGTFAGTVAPALATDVIPGRELLTGLAARTRPLAASNGGYFVIGDANGTDGDLAGISLLDGRLVSEAVNGRTSLLLPTTVGARASVEALATRHAVRSDDGGARELDGLNRVPGLIRGCGGTGGDQPTEAPKHDFTCTDPSELIAFAEVFGERTPEGPGAEALLDTDGIVTELRDARGGAIPAGSTVLSGTGDAADWLRTHAAVGREVGVGIAVLGERGPLPLGGRLGVVNGGPRLLRDGAPAITANAEGFHWPEDPGFLYRFGIRRNPRTLAGVATDGRLLLVAVEGRRPGYSVGASFAESAAILRALGAADGVNLDGGGSTAMTIGARLLGRPSDATGERPIGDAIVLRP